MAAPSRVRVRASLVAPALALGAACALAQAEDPAARRVLDLAAMPLEELMEVEVSAVSRRARRAGDVAAAVHVITREDIRRAGLASVPEALRLVPGLHVARINASSWAIAARGFNGRANNKLLVQVDGRSVYSPLFSGVFWDMQDLPLEDLDRIEVILGPGGTLWGANAVNGIINIVTRSAAETHGAVVEAGTGTLDRANLAARYGTALGGDLHLRVHAKHRRHDELETAAGAGAGDDWHATRAGFRADWRATGRDELMLQGELQSGRVDQTALLTSLAAPAVVPTAETLRATGAHLLARWQRRLGHGARTELQVYWDHVRRDEAIADSRADVLDLDFQHHLAARGRHELAWGFGYRLAATRLDGSFTLSLDDPRRHDQVFSAFVLDRIRLRDDLSLSLGSKIEHNDFTGIELQPSARLVWNASERHSLWAAVTRAVRTPTPVDAGLRLNQAALPGTPPVLVSVLGSPDLDAEEVIALEAGFRGAIRPDLTLDVALFYNRYDDLHAPATGAPRLALSPAPARVVQPLPLGNLLEAESYGLEAQASWQPARRWRLTAGYALLETRARPAAPGVGGEILVEGASPEQQLQLHSRLDLGHGLAFDTSVYQVDRLRAFDAPGYTRLDLRLGWQPHDGLEASLGVRNLLDDRHPEFPSRVETLQPSEVPRSLYARALWRW